LSVGFSEHIGPADAATTAFPVRILLADGHPIVRYGLKNLLQLEDNFEVVGEAGDGREVSNKVQWTSYCRRIYKEGNGIYPGPTNSVAPCFEMAYARPKGLWCRKMRIGSDDAVQ